MNERRRPPHGIEFSKEEALKLYPDTYARYATGGKYQRYKHVRYLSERIAPGLHRGGARFLITLPPRHGKSEFCSVWLPTWFLDQNPERRVILAGHGDHFAARWGSRVKDNFTTNSLISRRLRTDTKAKNRFMFPEGGGMITAGVGGQIIGEGADLFIIDDPIKTYKDAMSELVRENQKEWFRAVARTRLEPGASVVVLMQRWHEDDLIGWLSTQQEDDLKGNTWNLINLPAICEEANDPIGRSIGDPLCPERYDLASLKSLRQDLGELIWASLYQQRPAALEGNIVKRDWLQYYTVRPDKFEEKALFADLTYKDGESNDFTVVECWGRNKTSLYLLDQIRSRMDFPSQLNAIREMKKRHPDAYAIEIEEAANGAAVIATLKGELTGIIPVKPHTSKEARLHAVSPVYESRCVFYPNPSIAPWVEVNLSELLSFPNAKHDDTVDCATMALTRLGRMSSSVQRLEALARW